MNVKYDSMNDLTRISPKGKDAFTFDIPRNGFFFLPFIQVFSENIDNGEAILSVATGFNQDEWVFMEQIQFNADSTRFAWNIDLIERKTQVEWGSIYEWVLKTELYDENIFSDLERIVNSNLVELRYDGDTSVRNETLSKTHKQQISDILELYKLIRNL